MPTLTPHIHCGTEGTKEFDSPKQYDSLQRYSAEGKSEIWQGRRQPDGAKPMCSAWVFTGTQTSTSKDKAVWDTYPPPSCLPSAHSLLVLPSTTGNRGHAWMEVLMPRGCPPPTTLHKIHVAAASNKLCGDFLHTLYSLTISSKKAFFFLQNRTNSGSRRLGLEIFPYGKGV